MKHPTSLVINGPNDTLRITHHATWRRAKECLRRFLEGKDAQPAEHCASETPGAIWWANNHTTLAYITPY